MNIRSVIAQVAAYSAANSERTSYLNYVPNNYMPLTVRTWRMLMLLQNGAPEPYEHIQDRVSVLA